ncbi:hypothetical protein [Piscinibacter sakaiensis]|uniref:hypothetical protein n=1 Tax=Piscinibacter sakaiensis TaxID=1547922 RepID=UPI003AABBE47
MNPQAALATFHLSSGMSIAQTLPEARPTLTIDSPALDVMTDLSRIRAATTSPRTGLRQAEQVMIHQGVRMLFVVTDMPSIEGLVTSNDVAGDKPMRLVHERNVHFDELSVADVMTPLLSLDAVDFDQLQRATIGNLIATLQKLGRNHLLVVEQKHDLVPARIRGVVSRTQIERQTGLNVPISDIAQSFSEIERALA